MLQKYFSSAGFTYADYHRGILGAGCCFVAFLAAQYLQLNVYLTLWLVLTAALTCIVIQGQSKFAQIVNVLITAVVSAIVVMGITYLYTALHQLIFWLCAIVISYLVLLSPRVFKGQSIAVVIITVYLILAIYLVQVLGVDYSSLPHIGIAVFAGTALNAVIIFALPLAKVTAVAVDASSYFYKRSLRLSLSIPLGFYLASLLHLQHASWVCLTVIVVSQANIGATMRKSMHRLVGTLLGVLIGAPLAVWVFSAYPWTHVLALLMLFMGMVVAYRFYYLAVFVFTLLIAAMYYILFPHSVSISTFVLFRLLDTCIGVVLALLLEMLVFPQSALLHVRCAHKKFWLMAVNYITAVRTGDADLHHKYQQLQQSLRAIDAAMHDMRFEPIGQFTVRYKKSIAYFQLYHYLVAMLSDYNLQQLDGEIEASPYFARMVVTIERLSVLHMDGSADCVAGMQAIAKLQQQLCAEIAEQPLLFIKINECLLEVINLFLELVAIPRWRFGTVD